jgi:hypothetical protein
VTVPQTAARLVILPSPNFDYDVPLQFRIACAIDLAHSALAQKSRNFERAKSCTYIQRHWNDTGDGNALPEVSAGNVSTI